MLARAVFRWLPALLVCVAIWPSGGSAASQPPASQSQLDALTRARSAVVGVEVIAAEGARSAQTLGRERSGSGVVINTDGLVLTIGYLMLEAETIQVVTAEGRTLPARAVAYDLATGFGLLQPLLPLRGVKPVPLGSIAETKAGEPLMAAIGGEDADVAITQVVGKRPFSGYWEYHIDQALFTSPPIGNHSGAPVFNQRGELLGIGSLFVADAIGDGRRMPGNMFVPVDLLKPVLAELQKSGTTAKSRRPWIGITSSEQEGRVQVVRVTADGPAQAAGLRPGDVILAVDGAKVDSLEAFYKKLWDHPQPDEEVNLTILQGADIRTITVKPVDRLLTLKRPSGI